MNRALYRDVCTRSVSFIGWLRNASFWGKMSVYVCLIIKYKCNHKFTYCGILMTASEDSQLAAHHLDNLIMIFTRAKSRRALVDVFSYTIIIYIILIRYILIKYIIIIYFYSFPFIALGFRHFRPTNFWAWSSILFYENHVSPTIHFRTSIRRVRDASQPGRPS